MADEKDFSTRLREAARFAYDGGGAMGELLNPKLADVSTAPVVPSDGSNVVLNERPLAENPEAQSTFDRIEAEGQADVINQFPYMPTRGRGVPQEAISGQNYAAIGPDGEETFQNVAKLGPTIASQGYAAEAEVEAQEGQQLRDLYSSLTERAQDGAAKVLANRTADQDELRRRDEELKAKTSTYSQMLSDNSKFWHSPKAIFATIAAGLMELGSNKRGIGIKMLESAMAADFNQRKVLADTDLGALKSNLQGYRDIAKDREAGDLLAQSEMYRMAALEVDRIAQNFRGPKAQARAQQMIGDLMMKSNAFAGEFYRRNVYVAPQMVAPQLAAEMRNQPGFQEFGVKGPNRPAMGGSLGRNAAIMGVGPGTGVMASNEALAAMERRAPGSVKALQAAVAAEAQRALYEANNDPVLAKKLFDSKFAAEKAEIGKIGEKLADVNVGKAAYKALMYDFNQLEQSIGADNMDDFIGDLRSSKIRDIDQLIRRYGLDKGEDLDSVKGREIRRRNLLLKQALQGGINEYIRSKSGGAVSESEAKRLDDYISPQSSYSEIRRFVENESRNVERREAELTKGLSPRALIYYQLRNGGAGNSWGTGAINVGGTNRQGRTERSGPEDDTAVGIKKFKRK